MCGNIVFPGCARARARSQCAHGLADSRRARISPLCCSINARFTNCSRADSAQCSPGCLSRHVVRVSVFTLAEARGGDDSIFNSNRGFLRICNTLATIFCAPPRRQSSAIIIYITVILFYNLPAKDCLSSLRGWRVPPSTAPDLAPKFHYTISLYFLFPCFVSFLPAAILRDDG